MTRTARQTPVGARPNRRREAVLFDKDAAGRLLEGAGDRVPREMTIRSTLLRQNPAYRPGNSLPLVWLLLATATLGCSTRIPEQVVSGPHPEPVRVDEPPRAWTPRPGLPAHEYVIDQRARVTTTTDSGIVEDSTSLVVSASVRHVPGAGIAGLLLAIAVGPPGIAAVTPPGLSLPYAFSAPVVPVGSQYAPSGRAATDPCTTPAHVALGALRDLLVRMPDFMPFGVEWSDSGSFITCRDGVRLELSTTRRFKLVGFEQRPDGGVLRVARTATSTLRGSTARGDDTTRVEGTGTSTLQYELDAATAAVLAASGSGSLDVVVRGARRTQRARQTSSVRISVRVPQLR